MLRKMLAPLLATGLVAVVAAQAPDPIDTAMNTRIRAEGMNNSQILKTMHYLTDVYGPRLTGSPNHVNAAHWAVKQMESWGMKNGRLEPFDFGRPGWLNEKASGHIISPVTDNLVFEVLAWTPSTNGTVRGQAVHLVPPQGPTEAEMKQFLANLAPSMKDAIVLVGPHMRVAFQETPPAKRREDATARAQYNPDPNAPRQPRRRTRRPRRRRRRRARQRAGRPHAPDRATSHDDGQ